MNRLLKYMSIALILVLGVECKIIQDCHTIDIPQSRAVAFAMSSPVGLNSIIEQNAIIDYENLLLRADFRVLGNEMAFDTYESMIRYDIIKENNQVVHIIEIFKKNNPYIYSAFAKGYYSAGLETTSKISRDVGAIIAVNGSGFYQNIPIGPVIRQSELQNEKTVSRDVLWIDKDGKLNISFDETSTQQLYDIGATSSFTFGPALIDEHTKLNIDATYNSRRGANPRTAIGQRENGNILLVVAEGRFSDAKGLTLDELQELFMSYDARIAYNLDGGGSSTLVINGEIKNRLSDGVERRVADILYFY